MAHFSCAAESLIQSARVFACAAHGAIDQRRKYTNDPYIVHPEAVVELITRPFVGATWEMICAAWLHDVVEDTKVTSDMIYNLFGSEVGCMVDALTNVPASAGNRAARHAMNIDRLAQASPQAQTIKVADLIDNTKSITQHDPKFAELYLQEKAAALKVLTRANPQLLTMATNQISRSQKELFYA